MPSLLPLFAVAAVVAVLLAAAPTRGADRAAAAAAAARDGVLNVDAGVRDDEDAYQCTVDFSTANPGDARDLRTLVDASEAVCNVLSVSFHGTAAASDASVGVHDALPAAFGYASLPADVAAAVGADEVGAHALCAMAENGAAIVQAGCRTLTWASDAELCVDFAQPIDALYVKLGSLGKLAGVAAGEAVPALDASLGGGDSPTDADRLQFAADVDAELRSYVRFSAYARDADGDGADDDAPTLVGTHTESTTRVVDSFQVSTTGAGATFDRLCIGNGNAESADGFCIIELDQRCPAGVQCSLQTDSNPPPNLKRCDCYRRTYNGYTSVSDANQCAPVTTLRERCDEVADCDECLGSWMADGGPAGLYCYDGLGDDDTTYCCEPSGYGPSDMADSMPYPLVTVCDNQGCCEGFEEPEQNDVC